MLQFFLKSRQKTPSAALFLSGSGTNAEQVLKKWTPAASWTPTVLVTDRPETSAARRLAEEFNRPLIELDIAEFYRRHGLDKVSIRTPEGIAVRKLWTGELRKKLEPFQIDFGILAGFVPLTNLVEDFPCLNIHPGDLTAEKDGIRILAGLHKLPVERAILEHHTALRSSVIVVKPFSAGAREMDSGPILGISAPVPIDLQGHTADELQKIQADRVHRSVTEQKDDLLSRIAETNLERLKKAGDWVLFPQVIDAFASNQYQQDEHGNLFWKGQMVKTVEYSESNPPKGMIR